VPREPARPAGAAANLDRRGSRRRIRIPAQQRVPGRVEESYLQRIRLLPRDTRLLLLAAAAEPLGSRALLDRAAEILDLDMAAADPAIDAGCSHWTAPSSSSIRSPARRPTGPPPRRPSPRASRPRACDRRGRRPGPSCLASRAGHTRRRRGDRRRAGASASRAQARGGVAAAAALLRESVALTRDPARRADRALAAARADLLAGAFDSALGSLAAAEAGELDDAQRARGELLRAQIALVSNAGREAPRLLLTAAERFQSVDISVARETYLDAWGAAMFAGHLADGELLNISRAAQAAPRPARDAAPWDLLLDGLAAVVTSGRATAAPLLRRAVDAFRNGDVPVEKGLQWGVLASTASVLLWDVDSWQVVITRQADRARVAGAFAPCRSPSMARGSSSRGPGTSLPRRHRSPRPRR
jgi:hypothetical protein